MTEAFRVVGFDDLRDAVEALLEIDLSDLELAERGIALSQSDTLLPGLGPSAYTLIELGSGEQYLLHRLEYRPEWLSVQASLRETPQRLATSLMRALDIPPTRVVWRANDEFWDQARQSCDRAEWLTRRERLKGHS